MRTILLAVLLSGCIGSSYISDDRDAGRGAETSLPDVPGIWAPEAQTVIELGEAAINPGDASVPDVIVVGDGCSQLLASFYLDTCATHPGDGDAGIGWELPNVYVMELGGGITCDPGNTPAACACAETYNCNCLMPALWAEQAAQTGEHIVCGGTLSGCVVDTIGVIHVTCN